MDAFNYFEGDAHPGRLDNRRGIQTSSIRLVNPEAVQPLGLRLNSLGIPVKVRARLSSRGASTAIQSKDGHGQDQLECRSDLDALVDEIWAQFAYDLIQISPNLKDERDPPYVTLTIAQRDKVTIDLYKQRSLPFRSVYYRTRDREFWCQSFDKYFPPRGQVIAKAQNYSSCRYYSTWLRLREDTRATAFAIETIRNGLRRAFLRLLWLPYNELDRIWNTRKPCQTVHAWTHLSDSGLHSGVRILVNEDQLRRLLPQKLCLGRVDLGEERGLQRQRRREEREAQDIMLLSRSAKRLDRTNAQDPSVTGWQKPSASTTLPRHKSQGSSEPQERSGGSRGLQRPSATEDAPRRPVTDIATLLGLRTVGTQQAPSPIPHSKSEGKRRSEAHEGPPAKRLKVDGSKFKPVKEPDTMLVVHRTTTGNAAPPIPQVVLEKGRWRLAPAKVIKKEAH
ncbi:hypothetical protein FKP32DRAFT_1593720 [Trametes sanguinea]|nr:hypothetical protein FKP32DRAFT_1593720 [Trametes sanguinea]